MVIRWGIDELLATRTDTPRFARAHRGLKGCHVLSGVRCDRGRECLPCQRISIRAARWVEKRAANVPIADR